MTTNDGNERSLYQAPGLDSQDNLRLPPYLANIVLSGVSSMLGHALASAAYWGIGGGAYFFGGLGVVEATLLYFGEEPLLVANHGASHFSSICWFSAEVALIGVKLGAVSGAVKGLVTAEYQEFFDNREWEEAVCVGMCHPPENDY